MRDTAPTTITPNVIRAIRSAVGESTEVFGARFARSGRTVEEWEQGRRRPDPLILLTLAKLAKKHEITLNQRYVNDV